MNVLGWLVAGMGVACTLYVGALAAHLWREARGMGMTPAQAARYVAEVMGRMVGL